MRGVFVIFLLTAVKNIPEKKGGRGTAGLQKRLKKSHKRQSSNFFSHFFISTKKEKKNTHTLMTCPRSSLGLFLFTSNPFCSSHTHNNDPSLHPSKHVHSSSFNCSFIFSFLLIPLPIHHVPHPSLPLMMPLTGTFYFCISHPSLLLSESHLPHFRF